MRAAIFRNGEIVVDTMPEPKPAAGQVLVKTLCLRHLRLRPACAHARASHGRACATFARPQTDGSWPRRRVRARILLRDSRIWTGDAAQAEDRHPGVFAARAADPAWPAAHR